MAVRDRSACSLPVSTASSRDYVWSPKQSPDGGSAEYERDRPARRRLPRRSCARESATTSYEIGTPNVGKDPDSRLIVDGCFQASDSKCDPLLYWNVTPIETLMGNPTVIV